MVHQELAFCPDLSVAENLSMGRYPRPRPRGLGIFLSRREMRRRARDLLGQIGVSLDVRRPMRSLSTAQEQLVQIGSAVGTGAKILIFDEPTSSLSEPEAQNLFALIERLKAGGRGVTVIYVSLRMPEVLRLCDRISVLRDGKFVGTLDRSGCSQDQIVRMMIGRPIEQYFPQHAGAAPREVLLSVRNLTSPGRFAGISFDLREGEILGLAGLVGSGRSEVAKAIFGLDPRAAGEVRIAGRRLKLRSVRRSMRCGMGLVPEDRKRQGLVLGMSCRNNLSLAMLDRLGRFGLLDRARERRLAMHFIRQLHVKTPSMRTPVAALSGGNQQKIALAKWLARECRILIVDEPTRGVDVGAKAAIHAMIDDLARRGIAIILISSELPEVMNLASRILILRGGRIAGEVARESAEQATVLRLMAGV
jgi:ABC-type sugar transport system ATPase subunit